MQMLALQAKSGELRLQSRSNEGKVRLLGLVQVGLSRSLIGNARTKFDFLRRI